jgi:hypothetical protein
MTLLDGIVVARSTFNSSMNYRSVVVFGRGVELSDPAEKLAALERFSEHLIPGRWQDSRENTEKEMAATSIVSVRIEHASAKTRSGGAKDDPAEYALPFWAGVIPIVQQALPALDDEHLPAETAQPGYVLGYKRPSAPG